TRKSTSSRRRLTTSGQECEEKQVGYTERGVFHERPHRPLRPVRPPGAVKLDDEVELRVVIGRDGRHVGEADARRHVAAYRLVDDVSERAVQMERGADDH